MLKKYYILIAMLLFTLPAAAADFPAVEGWTLAGEVTAKAPDNLWEYNNGAAEAFLAYGFQGLSYADLKAGELVVTVEIYDMGSPINAYGIALNIAGPRESQPPGIQAAARAFLDAALRVSF